MTLVRRGKVVPRLQIEQGYTIPPGSTAKRRHTLLFAGIFQRVNLSHAPQLSGNFSNAPQGVFTYKIGL